MKAVVIGAAGGPEVLQVAEVAPPAMGPDEVRVQVRAAGLNRADVLQRRGLYPPPAGVRADIPGLELCGEVLEVGARVRRFEVGARVMGVVAGAAHAEQAVLHERELMGVPEGLSWAEAAAIPEAFVTAWDALVVQCGLGAGESLLVHAVGSGVGSAAVQLGAWLGARVLGTSRTVSKLERAQEQGLGRGLHCPEGFGKAQGREVAGWVGDGVDVVLDLIGAAYLDGNLHALGRGGRMVTLGLLGGARGELDLGRTLARRLTLLASTLRSRPLEEKIALARSFESRVLPAFATGALRPVVGEVYRFADVAAAHGALERNATFGKIVLTWD